MADSTIRYPYRTFRYTVEIDGIARGGFSEVCLCVSNDAGGIACVDFDGASFEEVEEHAGVAELLLCRLKEYGGYLLVA